MMNVTTLKLYQKVTAKSSSGQVVNTFPVVTARIQADEQPTGLTQEQAARWGQTDISANAKVVFIDTNALVRMLDRFVDADGGYFEVRGVNPWPIHTEVLMIPVQGETAPVSVDGIAVAPTAVSLAVLATLQLVATFTPATPTNQAMTWGSSNPAKATVSATGLVTAVATGTAVITVTSTDGSFTATCTVTVTP